MFIQLMLLAMLIGGMLSFQLLFAPLLFTKLKMATARSFIRKFFPFYYLYFALLSLMFGAVSCYRSDWWSLSIAATCFIGFVVSRQWLMPQANLATDQGLTARFNLLHRGTIAINTVQLLLFSLALYLCL